MSSYEATLRLQYAEVRKRMAAAAIKTPKPECTETPTTCAPAPPRQRVPSIQMSERMSARLAIYDVVEHMIGVPRKHLQSSSRVKHIIQGRRAACWLAVHFHIADGLKNVARMIGLTDHSSVWHHLREANKLRNIDPEYAALLDRLAHQVSEIVQHREIEQ